MENGPFEDDFLLNMVMWNLIITWRYVYPAQVQGVHVDGRDHSPICVQWKWGYSISMLVYQRVFEKAWPLVDQELTLKRCGFILWSPPWWGMWGLTVAAVWVDMLTLLFSGWHGHSDTDDFQDSTFSIATGSMTCISQKDSSFLRNELPVWFWWLLCHAFFLMQHQESLKIQWEVNSMISCSLSVIEAFNLPSIYYDMCRRVDQLPMFGDGPPLMTEILIMGM